MGEYLQITEPLLNLHTMRNSFGILFYTKRKEKLKNGRMPIMCKISVNGKSCTFSTLLSVEERRWDVRRKRVTGRSIEAKNVNTLLDRIYYNVYDAYMRLQRLPRLITPQAVRTLYSGQQSGSAGIVELFRRHNDEFARMVGLNRSISTLYKYRHVCKHLQTYISDRFDMADIPVCRIDQDFVRGFHNWLADSAKCSINTVWIYLIAFKHVVTQAIARGLLPHNPFTGYKLHCRRPNKSFLTSDELRLFLDYKPSSKAQCRVIDAFIFSCFTGLAYSDLKQLKMSDINMHNGRYSLSLRRTKTGADVYVPLLHLPYVLITRHRNCGEGTLFDLPSNNWCNTVLRSAASEMGINKRVSFHVARHTFATTITLANGIPIEVVSSMLGHASIKTTQIYARVLQASVTAEMSRASKSIESNYHIPDRLLSSGSRSSLHDHSLSP